MGFSSSSLILIEEDSLLGERRNDELFSDDSGDAGTPLRERYRNTVCRMFFYGIKIIKEVISSSKSQLSTVYKFCTSLTTVA